MTDEKRRRNTPSRPATSPDVIARKPPAGSASAGRSGAVIDARIGANVLRPEGPPDHVGNFFDANRAGKAVVRPNDFVALRIEYDGLAIDKSGSKPKIRKAGAGDAHLILHFPPQAVTEEAFVELNPNFPDTEVTKSDLLTGPPVRARISGESRIAFKVPDGFEADYSLAGILTAIEQLDLVVAANAREPTPAPHRGPARVSDIFTSEVMKLSAAKRAALTSYAARSVYIAAAQPDMTTLDFRSASGGLGIKTKVSEAVARPHVFPLPAGPQPNPPAAGETAIEFPWRLVISPYAAERWRHAKAAVTSSEGRTELWHSRLVAPNKDGIIEPPRPDAGRTVRAIWALTGEGSTQAMHSAFPAGADDLPKKQDAPFLTPLNDYDRVQIAHLSSNFSRQGYTPQAISTNLLMLSSLGAWLDSRGAWDVPLGMSVEEWVHHATMARDHYVRVVYKGFAFPFGHRMALIKVSERKFHNGAIGGDGKPTIEQQPGNPAYLRQRRFMMPRERERKFTDTSVHSVDGSRAFYREFPFTSVRILTDVTPNLDPANKPPVKIADSIFAKYGELMFWPSVNGQPFRFQWSATDLDGRTVHFELPIIFIENTLLSADKDPTKPDMNKAEQVCVDAKTAWEAALEDWRQADFKQQRVAMAQSVKAGDTSIQAVKVGFDAEAEKLNLTLRNYSDNLTHPPFYPTVSHADVRIAALAQLTGSDKTNTVTWNDHYLNKGFDDNAGQVFVDVDQSHPATMAKLDFSAQGDRAGGFVQPNLKPSAISRLTGPVTGKVSNFVSGTFTGTDAFPGSVGDLPLPLLFGCIPLGEILQTVPSLADTPERVPKFISEASTQLEQFINGLGRIFELVTNLADQPAAVAQGAIAAQQNTLNDLLVQTQSRLPTDPNAVQLVTNVKTSINQLITALDGVLTEVGKLSGTTIDTAPNLVNLGPAAAAAKTAATNLATNANASLGGTTLPSGFRQSANQTAKQIQSFCDDLNSITTLVTQAKALYSDLNAVVGDPNQLESLLGNAAELTTRIQKVRSSVAALKTTISSVSLLAGAPRQTLLNAIDAAPIPSDAELATIVSLLTGDELTIHFDWNPLISNWALPGVDAAKDPLFRVNDAHGFVVSVEAKVKKNGQSAPKITVVCSLKSFDLVLIAPASFLELNFDKIEFRVDSGAKMDVNVGLSDIKFVGPLSFVETLRDLIPLDGFLDPPALDITPQGIEAGFSVTLPNIAVGVFNLSNLSLGAAFTVPFIGQPLSVRFNFCAREQPFNLTVTLFGGGGFFAVTLDPHGVQILEAAFEFGASISIDFGVASGGVHVMAGVYFRMEKDACSLAGYFRLGGNVSVLGLISASLELYLELRYEFETGKCAGKASLTIEVEVFMFSTSVTVSCEKKFAGSNGDPTFRDLMGVSPALPVSDELALINNDTQYAWRTYCEAFA